MYTIVYLYTQLFKSQSYGAEYNDWIKRLEYPVESRSKGLNSPL